MSLKNKKKKKKPFQINRWLDVLALLAWGILLLKYVITSQIKLLIHPNYIGLVLVTGIILLVLAIIKGLQILRSNVNRDNLPAKIK